MSVPNSGCSQCVSQTYAGAREFADDQGGLIAQQCSCSRKCVAAARRVKSFLTNCNGIRALSSSTALKQPENTIPLGLCRPFSTCTPRVAPRMDTDAVNRLTSRKSQEPDFAVLFRMWRCREVSANLKVCAASPRGLALLPLRVYSLS